VSDSIVVDWSPPAVEEYVTLRQAVGWPEVPSAVAAAALRSSLATCNIRRAGELLGHARLTGDGQLFVYLQDVMVVPEAQGRGVGSMLVTELRAWIRRSCAQGAFVGLLAVPGTEPFYERHGFRSIVDVNTPMALPQPEDAEVLEAR
jgi:GNAT superfamily N-acetyltransferase